MSDEPIASAEARLLADRIQSVDNRVSENRRKQEVGFSEQSARLDRVEAQLRLMDQLPAELQKVNRAITEHAAADLEALSAIDRSLAGNTLATNETKAIAVESNAAVKALQVQLAPVITAMTVGRKTYAVAGFITGVAAMLVSKTAAFVASVVIIIAFVLWLKGMGPLPI